MIAGAHFPLRWRGHRGHEERLCVLETGGPHALC